MSLIIILIQLSLHHKFLPTISPSKFTTHLIIHSKYTSPRIPSYLVHYFLTDLLLPGPISFPSDPLLPGPISFPSDPLLPGPIYFPSDPLLPGPIYFPSDLLLPGPIYFPSDLLLTWSNLLSGYQEVFSIWSEL